MFLQILIKIARLMSFPKLILTLPAKDASNYNKTTDKYLK
jgi:hypothetical protein